MVDIASTDAGFLRPHVDTLLSAAFGVAAAKVDENVQHLGLELMISFAEGKPVLYASPLRSDPHALASTYWLVFHAYAFHNFLDHGTGCGAHGG